MFISGFNMCWVYKHMIQALIHEILLETLLYYGRNKLDSVKKDITACILYKCGVLSNL